MDKETTPRTYAAWKSSIDDAGFVCRMEPIWETMESLELDFQKLKNLLDLALEVSSDRITDCDSNGDFEWAQRNRHVHNILSGIIEEFSRSLPTAN